MIDLNITLIIQIINFMVALVGINFLIISPVRNVIRQRREMVRSIVDETAGFTLEAETRLKNYTAELETARTQAARQREALRQQGVESELAIHSSAQHEAQILLQKARKDIAQEVNAAKLILRSQVDDFAGKFVSRMLK